MQNASSNSAFGPFDERPFGLLLIGGPKGGVGKSTIASAVAHVAAVDYGHRVALVDLDSQASATWFGGADPVQLPGLERVSPTSAFGVSLFRGGAAIAGPWRPETARYLARAMDEHELVVADMRGTLDDGGVTRALLGAPGAALLVVAAAEPRSIGQARAIAALAEAADVPFRVVINRASRRTTSRKTAEIIRACWGERVCRAEIPDHAEVGRSELLRQPVTLAFPRSAVSNSIRAITAELREGGLI